MKAEGEDKGDPWQIADHFWADFNDLTQTGAQGQFFIGFALNLAGVTAYALTGILGEMVPAHELSPLVKVCDRFR
jgi:hypothetical protein